jgi:hypothetical protein
VPVSSFTYVTSSGTASSTDSAAAPGGYSSPQPSRPSWHHRRPCPSVLSPVSAPTVVAGLSVPAALLLLLLYFSPWYVFILAVNIALIVGIVWMEWPSETTVGRAATPGRRQAGCWRRARRPELAALRLNLP